MAPIFGDLSQSEKLSETKSTLISQNRFQTKIVTLSMSRLYQRLYRGLLGPEKLRPYPNITKFENDH